MIIRIIAVDPRPRNQFDDVVVYQVPEHSRAMELLIELLDASGIEWTTITTTPRRSKRATTQD